MRSILSKVLQKITGHTPVTLRSEPEEETMMGTWICSVKVTGDCENEKECEVAGEKIATFEDNPEDICENKPPACIPQEQTISYKVKCEQGNQEYTFPEPYE